MRTHGSLLALIASAAFAAYARAVQPGAHVLGTLMPEQAELEDTTVALRAELRSVRAANNHLMKQLEECEAKCTDPFLPKAQYTDQSFVPKTQDTERRFPEARRTTDQSLQRFPAGAQQHTDRRFPEAQHHRKALATPTPTPVPTTEDVTTHAQLSVAVANKVSDEIVITSDLAFPSQSPISFNNSQLCIVGRSSFGSVGGRVTLDGLGGSRFFVVGNHATLHLTNLDLAGGTVPDPHAGCGQTSDPFPCMGGAILVLTDATLVVVNCDIRGQGSGLKTAEFGGGVFSLSEGTTLSFFNVSFENLYADRGAAVNIYEVDKKLIDRVMTFESVRFTGNVGMNVVEVGDTDVILYFYGCVWENNVGLSLHDYETEPGRVMGGLFGCIFRNNTAPDSANYQDFGAGVIALDAGLGMDIADCLFERNTGRDGEGYSGAVVVSAGSFCTLTNCTFLENKAFNGGALVVLSSGSMTITRCYFWGNIAQFYGGDFYIDAAMVTIINSTFTGSTAGILAGFGYAKADSSLVVENSVFSGGRALYGSGFFFDAANVLMTDCIVRDTECLTVGAFFISGGSSIHLVRAHVQNHRATQYGTGVACLYVRASTTTVEDSDLVDFSASGAAPAFFLRSGGHLQLINSRIVGSTVLDGSNVYQGPVGYVDSMSSVRIVGGTIMNASGPDELVKAAIYDGSIADFGVQLDSVVVDETVSVFSNGSKILLQNCEGFSSTAVAKAEVATCTSTTDYCLRESCVDTTTGIDCICEVDGVETPFPAGCMESAVIEVLLPSSHTLTYITQKPFNETSEFLLANVRARMPTCHHAVLT